MQTNHYKFSEIAINFDKKRIPLSTMEREKRKGEYRYYGAQGIILMTIYLMVNIY